MKIVILGYSGSIGTSLLKYLLKYNSFDLVCVGRDVKKYNINSVKLKYIKWDFNSFTKSSLHFLEDANIIVNCIGKTSNSADDIDKINLFFVKKIIRYLDNLNIKIRFIHLSSVSVYGSYVNALGWKRDFKENAKLKFYDNYSKTKSKSELFIKNQIKKKENRNLSYTILRISNVFGNKKSNLYKYILLSLKYNFWIKSSNDVLFNFINEKDVAQAIYLVILNPDISRNKTYNVTDDCKQIDFYKGHQKMLKKKIIQIQLPIYIIKFLVYLLPLPKKILNFFFTISSKVTYNNNRITKDLNFKPKYSFIKKIK